MKGHDRGGSLFWLIFSVCVCTGSIRLGLGTPRNPGMGFMTFGASVLLGVFSLIVFFQTLSKGGEAEIRSIAAGPAWRRVLFVLAAILIYAEILPVLGYLIATFLLMAVLFWVLKGMKWWSVVGSSLLTTISTYYVFSKWLNCQFPEGLFWL